MKISVIQEEGSVDVTEFEHVTVQFCVYGLVKKNNIGVEKKKKKRTRQNEKEKKKVRMREKREGERECGRNKELVRVR